MVVVTLIVSFGLAACGGDEGTSSVAARDSGFEGVPVPTSARSVQGPHRTWIVEDMSFDELVAWYEEHLPDDRDFGRWKWCKRRAEQGSHDARYYSHGAQDILTVSVNVHNPPQILMGTDKSGPC
jgi:hypothetical protein